MTDALSGREVLAIDAGTQGLSVILWCPERKRLLGVGDTPYEHDYIPGLSDGRLEQYPHYWSDALRKAMIALRQSVGDEHSQSIDSVAGDWRDRTYALYGATGRGATGRQRGKVVWV